MRRNIPWQIFLQDELPTYESAVLKWSDHIQENAYKYALDRSFGHTTTFIRIE